MDELKKAVTVANQAVSRVGAIVAGLKPQVKLIAGAELRALSDALTAIAAAQSEIVRAIEGVRNGQ